MLPAAEKLAGPGHKKAGRFPGERPALQSNTCGDYCAGAGAGAGAAGCAGVTPGAAAGAGTDAGACTGAGKRVSMAFCWFTLRTGPPAVLVSTCVLSESTIKPMAKPQVSFSSKSPVRFTPIMLAAPPALNWLESPPPLGFWASTTSASKKQTIRIRMMRATYMRTSGC